MIDRLGRPLGALRISVTDRCNLRCAYCMPAAAYRWLPQESLLSDDEIVRVAAAFVGLGVRKLRITGGEPLLRPGLPALVALLAGLGVDDLALTTNATRLAPVARGLADAGLDRVTVSLDTLRPERMKSMARHDRLHDVLSGIDAALAAGLPVKLNSVVMRGVNDDEIVDLARFAFERGIEPRFIEYMDVGGAVDWQPDLVVSRREIITLLESAFGVSRCEQRAGDPHAPAERWQFEAGRVGVVSSTTQPFCGDCDRARLTADGTWYRCLYEQEGIDLRAALRAADGGDSVATIIAEGWAARQNQGAVDRLAMPERGALVPLQRLRSEPHLEMHVRGG